MVVALPKEESQDNLALELRQFNLSIAMILTRQVYGDAVSIQDIFLTNLF